MDLAARSAVREGLRRQTAVLEFMVAFDRAKESAHLDRNEPAPIIGEFRPEDFTSEEETRG